jgi:hypothetical protein
MANHIRQQIRTALAARLAGLSTTGANVFMSRNYAFDETELPGLSIKNGSEESQVITLSHPAEQSRDYLVIVEARAKNNSNLDDVLDQICKEVEVAIAADDTLSGLVSGGVGLLSTNFETTGDFEKPQGVATMIFKAAYFCFENSPDIAR